MKSILLFIFLASGAFAADPGYRVVVQPRAAVHGASPFPRSDQPWELRYQFIVPPLPSSKSWDPTTQVFYIWGDVDFDTYGFKGSATLTSKYLYNQIVPQLMIGYAFAENDANFAPTSIVYDHWVINAQYYWNDVDGNDFAQAGEIVAVQPGDSVTTLIRYNPQNGAIIATISAPEGTSTITIPRPFPNDKQIPFSSWRDFFAQAEAKTTHVLGQAVINVESHDLDEATLCSVLPFEIQGMSSEAFPKTSADFLVRTEGGFNCPSATTKLGF